MINTCQPVNNQRNVKKSQLQNVGYVLLYLFSLHLSWRPLSALLVSCPGEPFLFYFIVFALVFAYMYLSPAQVTFRLLNLIVVSENSFKYYFANQIGNTLSC